MLALAFMLAPATGMTLTAYTVETPTGTAFVPFALVHPRVFVTPLVVFA